MVVYRSLALSSPVIFKLSQVRTWMLVYGFTNSFGAMFIKILFSWRISKKVKATAKTTQSTKVINEIVSTIPFSLVRETDLKKCGDSH